MQQKYRVMLASSLFMMPVAVFAQSGNNEGGGLEEVVVTAERREASLQEVPIPVTALSVEALENRQVTEAKDLQRYVPSLRMSNNITSPTNLSPSLRGSLQQDASLVVAESPFGIYVDDIYIARLNGNNVTLADIEQVEVLRGPQGTLYGRNTLAGAIKFTSRTPDQDNEWTVIKGGFGNYNQYSFQFSKGGALSDNWAGSVAVQTNRKDGQWFNRVTNEATGLEENTAMRAKLHYTGGDIFDAVFSLAYSGSHNDANQLLPGISPTVPSNRRYTSDDVQLLFGRETLATPRGTRSPAIIGSYPSGSTKQTIASAKLSWDMGAYTFSSITGYVYTKDYFSTDFSGVGQVLGASNPRAGQFSEELQIQGSAMDDKLTYIAGVYYFDEDGRQAFGWNITRPFFNVGPVSTSSMVASTKSTSVFGQFDYQFTDQLKATAGVRWVQDKKTFNHTWQALFAPIPAETIARRNTYTEVTPKFGIDYKVSTDALDSLMLFFSAARGFKSGGYNGINITDALIARSPYGPESNWTYELGAKSEMFNRRVRLNGNFFLAKIKDLALNATVPTSTPGVSAFPVQNAGDATIKGLELEALYVPTDNLNIFLNASFLDGKYDSLVCGSAPEIAGRGRAGFTSPCGAPTSASLAVNPEPPQLPNVTFSLGFDYGHDVQLGSRDGRIKFGADVYRTADYITAATNDFVITAYSRVNAFVGLDIGDKLEARLTAKNMGENDKVYVGSRGFLGGYLVLPPFEWTLSLTYRQ